MSCEETTCTAAGSGRKEIKQGSNEDKICNEDTEKNEGPRLLQIGWKDTWKDDQQLKPVPRCNLGYGKTKNPNFLCGFFCIGQKQKRIYGDEFVDAHRVNAGIWYQDDKGLPDLLSEPM
jgi:hypothetical protein